jgi:molecular chaperone Hsp33
VGQDLAHYLFRSEQVPSAVGIGVFVRPDGSVEAAGGYIVQLLPGISERDAAELERIIGSLPHPTTMLRSGETPEEMLGRIFGDAFQILDRRDVRFECHCSLERAERVIRMLGRDAVREMIDEGCERGGAEVTCEFCTERYFVPTEQLQLLHRQLGGEAA